MSWFTTWGWQGFPLDPVAVHDWPIKCSAGSKAALVLAGSKQLDLVVFTDSLAYHKATLVVRFSFLGRQQKRTRALKSARCDTRGDSES